MPLRSVPIAPVAPDVRAEVGVTRRAQGWRLFGTVPLMVALLAPAAAAQDFGGRPLERFRTVAEAGRFAGSPAVEGWLYNDGMAWITNIRLRVEVLDAEGKVVTENSGWVNGDLRPKGRAYFMVPVKTARGTFRVTVQSYDVVAAGGQ